MEMVTETRPVKRAVRDRYREIDVHGKAEAWPDPMPPLSTEEATKAARLLWRFVNDRFYREKYGVSRAAYYKKLGRKAPKAVDPKVKMTSGRRYNRLLYRGFVLNPGRGWENMVHELSHDFHNRVNRGKAPHSVEHSYLEKAMVAYVLECGWLEGKLKPVEKPAKLPKPKPDPRVVAHDRVCKRITAWKLKLKRATSALAKLEKEEKKLAKRRPLFTLN